MLIKTAIKRPVTTIMAILIVILAGVISLTTLKLDLMPSIDIPMAIVSTTYVGAGPEEIENLITKPIEEAVGTVSNVDTISSTSSSNSSMVMIQFVDGTNIDTAASDLREKIDLIKGTLPEDASEPMVMKLDINEMSSIVVGVGSDKMDIADLTAFVDDNISSDIEKIDGVASVSLIGGIDDVINITLDSNKMNGYGITASQITNALKAENINMPIGQINNGSTKITAKTVGEFKSLDDIKNILLTTSGGSTVRLSDVADVELTTEDEKSYAIVNGSKRVIMSISKQSDANIVDISDKINAEIAKINQQYPDLSIKMLSDTSEYIRTSVNNVLTTAFQAAILAVIVLFIFLRSISTSAIIAVSIPTSIVATFALMYMCDMTLNIISLGGITIGIGMLVDNSVVVLENIYKYHSKGYPAKEAAEIGASEVGLSVMASTLTTVAVFIPLMFVSGTIGQMFKDLSLTVCFSLGASLVVSLSFVPMACSKLLVHEERSEENLSKGGPIGRPLDKWGAALNKIDTTYRKCLHFVLRRKKRTLLVTTLIFILSIGLIPIVGFDLMPTMDEGSASISIEMPSGTVIDETTNVVNEVMNRISDIPETEEYYIMAGSSTASMLSGSSQTDTATITLNFVDIKDRNRSTDQIVEDIKERVKTIPGADITVSASSSAMGSYSAASDVEIQINGDDIDNLRQAGYEIEKIFEQQPWAKDVVNSSETSVLEANVVINREKASQYGLTTSAIASTLSTAVNGSTATTYKLDGDEIDVIIKDNEDRVSYLNDLQKVTIQTSRGIIPITDVVDISTDESATSISRTDNHKYLTIGLNLNGIDSNQAQKNIVNLLNQYSFPDGCSYEFTGDIETMVETFQSLLLALVVALALVYMIMASQFESLIHPFLIMFAVPLAITGAVFGLFITGESITSVTFMGFIMLVGMVVNNGIVLIDYTNQLRAKGMECIEALEEAGPNRLRPILMTTLTTVIGMVPMALAIGEGTEMQRPMAVAIIFGLSISTLVTLFFIPVLYSAVESIRLKNVSKKTKNKLFGSKFKDHQVRQ